MGWVRAAGALAAVCLLAGCASPDEGERHEAWEGPSAPPSLSAPPSASASAVTSASPSPSATTSPPTASGTSAPIPTAPAARPPARPGGGGGTSSGGSGGGSGGGGGGGTSGGGQPEPPVAPAPPSQEAPAGGTDGFPYDGDLCAGTDHGPYVRITSATGTGTSARVTGRVGYFSCNARGEPSWTSTPETVSYPLNPDAHITVTTPFVPAGQRTAMSAAEFLRRVNAQAGKRALVFHYQTDPEALWIVNQIDPAQY
ncbi:hypothetical protein [Streptomyces sp. NPDC008141]|uniref:hypothetical protein n=1 Tax=Streptomyces sp. NPDC008141 TaxID=3364815 RepID=UPI0036E77A66